MGYISEVVTVEHIQGYYICDKCGKRQDSQMRACSYCGRYLCGDCCKNWNYDYDNLISLEPNMGDYPDRVCKECFEIFTNEFKERSNVVWDKINKMMKEFDKIREEFRIRVRDGDKQ